MLITGILYSGVLEGVLDERKERTSVCDWRVIKTDSADVMQPLHARQSFKLIWACSSLRPLPMVVGLSWVDGSAVTS